jgi:transcriptional regulator with PAS, ATPase and Fis domain
MISEHGALKRPDVVVVDWNSDRGAAIAERLLERGVAASCSDVLPEGLGAGTCLILMPDRWPPFGEGAPACTQLTLATLRQARRAGGAVVVFHSPRKALEPADGSQYLEQGASAYIDSDDPERLAGKTMEAISELRTGSPDAMRAIEQISARLGIVWRSRQMQEVMEMVWKAAQLSSLTVLISGPSGAGKQLLAEALHGLDPRRRNGPFIAVNCAAIPEPLAESELFGHNRGAYTGACRDRLGFFRAADRGTLFLDEISALDLSLQPKLLCAVQQRRIRSLGQDAEVPVDIRLVAATNADLRSAVGEGQFRLDLFQRLTAIEIAVPPLSERTDDIEPLLLHFLEKYRQVYHTEVTEIGPGVLDALMAHSFEGNIRELQNIVSYALFHKRRGDTLELADLPRVVLERAPAARPGKAGHELVSQHLLRQVVMNGRSFSEVVESCEWELLRLVLEHTQGNRKAAATLLKLNQRTFYNKLRQYRVHDLPVCEPAGNRRWQAMGAGGV